MSAPYDSNQRQNRVAVAQQRLVLLHKYGRAGTSVFSALDRFREMTLQLSTDLDESFEDDLFRYQVGSKLICLVNWHRNGLQIIFDPKQTQVVYEVDDAGMADWDHIREELIRFIPG